MVGLDGPRPRLAVSAGALPEDKVLEPQVSTAVQWHRGHCVSREYFNCRSLGILNSHTPVKVRWLRTKNCLSLPIKQ